MERQDAIEYPLIASFGEFMRKFWNPRPFKSQISPHELIQVSIVLGFVLVDVLTSLEYCEEKQKKISDIATGKLK